MIEATLVQQNLSQRLLEDQKFRKLFLRSRTRNKIASQLRRLRKLRNLKQTDLKKKKLHQSHISRIEQANYASWTYRTLLRMTEELDGVLDVTIRPIEEFASQLALEEKIEEEQFRKEAVSEMIAALLKNQATGESQENAAKAPSRLTPGGIYDAAQKLPAQSTPGVPLSTAANQRLATAA